MPSYAYFRKQFVPLSEAKIGVMTHALHYGTALFEGIRGNWNDEQQQLYLFRLKEHYQRLHNGCRILKVDLPYSVEELCQITVELTERCGFREDVYVRPLAYKSAESLVAWSDSNKLLEVFLELPYRKAYFFGDENAEHPTVTAVGDIPKVKIRQSGHFPMIDNPKEFYGELFRFISGANRI